MSDIPRNVTRNQLAEFLPNQRLVRIFEQILKQVNSNIPDSIDIAYLEASLGAAKAQNAIDSIGNLAQSAELNSSSADRKASQALSALNRIADALDLIAKAPAVRNQNSLATDYIDLNVNPKFSRKVGRIHWGPTGTLEIEMGNGNITQQVGEEFFVYGKASAAITEGQLIYITGVVGASGAVTFAPSPIGLTDPNPLAGVATEDIALNAFGRVTTLGVVNAINTSGSSVGEVWADGDVLWYNTVFVGGMTKTKPVAPNMKTQVARVLRAAPGNGGVLQIEVIHGSKLGDTDSNVQLGALADKQLLQYDSGVGYWRNVASSGTGIVAAETNAATGKTTPVDADLIPITDSAASFVLKKLTWANLKATLATWIGGNLIAGSFTSLVSSTTGKVATTLGVGNATPSASGAGISFPATQSASTDVNTLDDYEEGTWTPIDSSGASLAVAGSGSYVKIGKAVYFQSVIVYPATANASTALIGGLPFTTSAGSGSQGRSGLYISASTVALVGGLYTDNSTTFFVHTTGLTKATNANLTGATLYVAGMFFV